MIWGYHYFWNHHQEVVQIINLQIPIVDLQKLLLFGGCKNPSKIICRHLPSSSFFFPDGSWIWHFGIHSEPCPFEFPLLKNSTKSRLREGLLVDVTRKLIQGRVFVKILTNCAAEQQRQWRSSTTGGRSPVRSRKGSFFGCNERHLYGEVSSWEKPAVRGGNPEL